jgi:hypothetical protein
MLKRKSNESKPLRVDVNFAEPIDRFSNASGLSVREFTRKMANEDGFDDLCFRVANHQRNQLEDALESLRPYPKRRLKK